MQKPAARRLHGIPRLGIRQSITQWFVARAPPPDVFDLPPSVAFLSAISQCRTALLDEPLKLAAHVLARRVLSFEIPLQAGHVIDAGTDLREGRRIAPARPQTGQEISGDEAERERDKKAQSGHGFPFWCLALVYALTRRAALPCAGLRGSAPDRPLARTGERDAHRSRSIPACEAAADPRLRARLWHSQDGHGRTPRPHKYREIPDWLRARPR